MPAEEDVLDRPQDQDRDIHFGKRRRFVDGRDGEIIDRRLVCSVDREVAQGIGDDRQQRTLAFALAQGPRQLQAAARHLVQEQVLLGPVRPQPCDVDEARLECFARRLEEPPCSLSAF